jgi:hypothetical protein
VAQIVIDGGSWWCREPEPAGKLMKAGVYETNDAAVIQAANDAGLDWVRVVPGDSLPVNGSEQAGPPIQVVDAKPADDGAESGPMTLGDIKAPNLVCSICAENGTRTQPFANTAALNSHRRSRHPELDPATGLVRDGVDKRPDLPNVQQTVDETAQGVMTPENIEPVPGPPATPTPTPIEA